MQVEHELDVCQKKLHSELDNTTARRNQTIQLWSASIHSLIYCKIESGGGGRSYGRGPHCWQREHIVYRWQHLTIVRMLPCVRKRRQCRILIMQTRCKQCLFKVYSHTVMLIITALYTSYRHAASITGSSSALIHSTQHGHLIQQRKRPHCVHIIILW